ncbi:hypothetical protein ACEQ8H_008473 [Pleosporales sp. CAS-2024a]
MAARITLLETTPALKGFLELSFFRHARFEGVFKSTPLPDSTPATFVNNTNNDTNTSVSAAAMVGKTAGTNEKISITPKAKTNKSTRYAYYNKDEQRLDEPLPPRDPSASASLEERMRRSGKKLCNFWHLSGHCENGKFCHFQHEPKLTPAELNALKYKTRSLPCKNRYCDKIDCYLGHQCALERDFGKCQYPDKCHLRATHGMDRTKYVRYDKDGNAEYA